MNCRILDPESWRAPALTDNARGCWEARPASSGHGAQLRNSASYLHPTLIATARAPEIVPNQPMAVEFGTLCFAG